MLRYFRGVQGAMIRWCAYDVTSTHAVGKIYGFADASSAASLTIVPIANARLPTISVLTMLSFLGDLV